MKKLIFLIPFIFLLSCNSGADISPSDTYVKFYGGGATYELMDMTLRADGQEGVVLLALRTGDLFDSDGVLLDANRSHLYVVVTDGSGNTELEKRIPIVSDVFGTIQDDLEDAIRPARITSVDGGGYLVVCSANATFIDELTGDPIGNEYSIATWAQFDDDFELSGATPTSWNAVGDTISNYVGIDINTSLDGGIVVAGHQDSNGTYDFFYEKTGTTDDWFWSPPRNGSDDRVARMFPISNGGFAILGRSDVASTDGEGGANVERRLITSDGIVDNSLTYGITWQDETGAELPNVLHDVPFDVIERPGGFAVVGASFQNASLTGESIPFFMGVDLTGANSDEIDFRLELQTGNNQSYGRAIGITQTTTNDFIIVGEVDGLDDNGKEIMILKADQSGELIAEPIRYGLLNGDESARRAITASDGSIYVGATYDFGGGLSQIGLLKLNPDGELKQ